MKLKTTKISDLTPHSKNANRHPEEQLTELESSLEQFEQVKNIVAWNGKVIAGCGLLEAAKRQGKDVIEVQDVSHWPEKKALAYMIADNRLPELAIMDDDLLSGLLSDFDEPLDIPGVDENFLDELDFGDDNEGGNTDPDSVPEVVEPVVKSGELWLLGKHKLLCGDCTQIENIERLINEEKVDCVFTDPPYGINVVKENKVGADFGIAQKGKYSEIAADKTTDTAKKFYQACISLGFDKFIIWGGNYFINFLPFSDGWLIWNKRAGTDIRNTFADGEMAWCSFHTPIRIYDQLWNGMIREGEKEKRVHPTQKPIRMLTEIITNHIKNDLIFDGFFGSGSTLMAAEKTSRICYGIEISKHYCTIILQRYADFTNNDPSREDGMKFSELKDSLKTKSPAHGES